MNPENPTSDPDDADLRRLWQAAPEVPGPSSQALRQQLAGRRRRLLLDKTGRLAALLLVPPVLLWICLRYPLGPLGLAGLLMAGAAVLAGIWKQQRAVRLFYSYPAQDAPAAYVARLRRYLHWQQRYGLQFYQGYVLLLNTGLALFFVAGYAGRPAWQLGLPLALAALTALVWARQSHQYAAKEQQETAQLLRVLEGFGE